MKLWKNFINKWRKFLAETARANEKMWQNKPPSCCGGHKK